MIHRPFQANTSPSYVYQMKELEHHLGVPFFGVNSAWQGDIVDIVDIGGDMAGLVGGSG